MMYFNTLACSRAVIRTDLDLKAVNLSRKRDHNGLSAHQRPVFTGQSFKVSDEIAADLLAETIKRTFASSVPSTLEKRQELTHAFNHFLDDGVDLLKSQEYKEPES